MTTTDSADTGTVPVLRVLAGQEIRNYLRSKLYWVGAGLLTGVTVLFFVDRDTTDGLVNGSSALDMIAPAALLGLFGLLVMAGLTQRSDRAAAAAGTVAVAEHTRTAALAIAIVVPVVTGLLWFVAAVIYYLVEPPSPSTVPFGPVTDAYVFVVMFALSVVSAAGGPILGLLIARWLPRRGVPVFAVVLLVLVTILMQGNFRSTYHWRVVWPWTYWYGPFGFDTGTSHWLALPGSPEMWVLYLVALCTLGILVAIYHDPQSNRGTLRKLISAVGVIAVVALALTMTLGLHQPFYNPIVGS